MAQQLQTHAELGYLAIVLLLAYVLSSAPRLVRDMGNQRNLPKTEHRSLKKQMINAGKLAIDEYVKAWKIVRQSVQPVAAPVKNTNSSSLTQDLPGFLHNN